MAEDQDEDFFSADSLEVKDDLKKVKPKEAKRSTYLQIYQNRLLNESRRGLKCEKKAVTARLDKRRRIKSSSLNAGPTAVTASNSEVKEKIELLNKRLEYGKRTNLMNKSRLLLLKTKAEAKRGTHESSEQGSFDDIPNEQANIPNEIHVKLQQLEIRHQQDKKITENIRQSLSSQCFFY